MALRDPRQDDALVRAVKEGTQLGINVVGDARTLRGPDHAAPPAQGFDHPLTQEGRGRKRLGFATSRDPIPDYPYYDPPAFQVYPIAAPSDHVPTPTYSAPSSSHYTPSPYTPTQAHWQVDLPGSSCFAPARENQFDQPGPSLYDIPMDTACLDQINMGDWISEQWLFADIPSPAVDPVPLPDPVEVPDPVGDADGGHGGGDADGGHGGGGGGGGGDANEGNGGGDADEGHRRSRRIRWPTWCGTGRRPHRR